MEWHNFRSCIQYHPVVPISFYHDADYDGCKRYGFPVHIGKYDEFDRTYRLWFDHGNCLQGDGEVTAKRKEARVPFKINKGTWAFLLAQL
jgi:hypothetical protein